MSNASNTILAAVQNPAWEIKDPKPHPIGLQFTIRGSAWRGKVMISENGAGIYNVRFFITGQKKPVVEDTTISNVSLEDIQTVISQKVG